MNSSPTAEQIPAELRTERKKVKLVREAVFPTLEVDGWAARSPFIAGLVLLLLIASWNTLHATRAVKEQDSHRVSEKPTRNGRPPPVTYTCSVNNTSILRYSDILEGFVGFDDWLSSLGIPVRGNDRAHESLRILERAESAFQKGLDGDEAGISKSQYLFGLTEALELHDVYVAFRNHPRQQVRERLVRALSGPALPDAETKNSRDGRNVMFELALGAEWYLQGARVDLLEPDLSIKTPKGQYLLACKRPQHEHGIRAAVRSAASQLRSALAASSEHTVGIIAISLAHVLNRGSSFFSGRYEQLSELLNGLMSVHRDSWRTANFHPRNIAVLFHAHTPANWGEGLFRLSASVVGPPVREGGGYQVLKNDLAQLYSVGFAAWRD